MASISAGKILKLLNTASKGEFEVAETKEANLVFEAKYEGQVVDDISGNLTRREAFDVFLEQHTSDGFKLTYKDFYRGEDRYMQHLRYPVLTVMNPTLFFKMLIKENTVLEKNADEVRELQGCLANMRCNK